MIRKTEIRLGNYVRDRGGKVIRIDFIELIQKGVETKFGQRIFIDKKEVHPMTEYTAYAEVIPLTEKWLLDFGFILYSTGSFCKHLNNDDSYLVIDLKYKNGVWLNINQEGVENSIKLSHIKNVHELQNVYYSLTGIELQLKDLKQ